MELWGKIPSHRLSFFEPGTTVWQRLDTWAVPVCGSLAAQELVSRILATRCAHTARKASVLGGGMYVLVGLMPVFLGLAGENILPNVAEPEQFLALLARKHLSEIWQVLFLGALISAILSTVDSTLLAAAALVSHNLILPLRKDWSESAKVNLARSGVVLGGLVALGLALQSDSIHELVQSASSFGSAGIFVVTVFGLFTRFGGPRAAQWALWTGTAVWCAGTWVVSIPCVYLVALAGALIAYVAGSMPFAGNGTAATSARISTGSTDL
jgi:Na+/proline symporter